MRSVYRWLRSALVLCMVMGWIGYAPAVSPTAVQAIDTLPSTDAAAEQEYLTGSASLQPVSIAEEQAIKQANLVRDAADRAPNVGFHDPYRG